MATHRAHIPKVCDICGTPETHEQRSTGFNLDVEECPDGLMRCDHCAEDYDPEEAVEDAFLN